MIRLGLIIMMSALMARSPVPAQQPTEIPGFEVVSIRPPNPAGDRGTNMSTQGGTLRMHNATLKFCIMTAYGVQDFLIEGGPGWVNTDPYEIIAKSEGPAPNGQFARMLQTLLAERFGLAVHRETKQLPVYALIGAKNGPKLRPSDPGTSNFLGRRGAGGPLIGQKATMPALASTLSNLTHRTVLDRTGLTGAYDFTLEYAPMDAIDSPLPSLFTALQEQLGLKLEATKGPVEVLVIDHAEKPTQD